MRRAPGRLTRRDLGDLRSRRELQLVACDARAGDLADDGRLDAEVRECLDEKLGDARRRLAVGVVGPLRRLGEDARRGLDDVGRRPEREPGAERAGRRETAARATERMPEGFRTPVILFYFEDMSYRDIAEQMDLPLGTVMSRLARAKAYLRGRLLQPETPLTADGHRRATDGL